MITVKLYGLLRLESGIKECYMDANSIKELLILLEQKGLDRKQLSGCNLLVNGKAASKHSPLTDGDTVQLFPPVAGG